MRQAKQSQRVGKLRQEFGSPVLEVLFGIFFLGGEVIGIGIFWIAL